MVGLSDVSTPDTGKGSELKTGGRRTNNMPKEGLSYASYEACIRSARELGKDESPCDDLKKPGKESAAPKAQNAGKKNSKPMKNPKPRPSQYTGSV